MAAVKRVSDTDEIECEIYQSWQKVVPGVK
jgi:hypothetical protein